MNPFAMDFASGGFFFAASVSFPEHLYPHSPFTNTAHVQGSRLHTYPASCLHRLYQRRKNGLNTLTELTFQQTQLSTGARRSSRSSRSATVLTMAMATAAAPASPPTPLTKRLLPKTRPTSPVPPRPPRPVVTRNVQLPTTTHRPIARSPIPSPRPRRRVLSPRRSSTRRPRAWRMVRAMMSPALRRLRPRLRRRTATSALPKLPG